jgi:hypothetical protein
MTNIRAKYDILTFPCPSSTLQSNVVVDELNTPASYFGGLGFRFSVPVNGYPDLGEISSSHGGEYDVQYCLLECTAV